MQKFRSRDPAVYCFEELFLLFLLWVAPASIENSKAKQIISYKQRGGIGDTNTLLLEWNWGCLSMFSKLSQNFCRTSSHWSISYSIFSGDVMYSSISVQKTTCIITEWCGNNLPQHAVLWSGRLYLTSEMKIIFYLYSKSYGFSEFGDFLLIY